MRHQFQPVSWQMRVEDAFDRPLVRLAAALGIAAAVLGLMVVSSRADTAEQNPNYSVSQTGAVRVAKVHRVPHGRRHARSLRAAPVHIDANGTRAEIIGGRPAGCPHAYCGCGLRKYLGISDARLDLAWNWTKYYRGDQPVAVWHHHVALIEQMVGPRLALLRDFNSGGGLSRLHVRSIAGAVIINGYGREARL